MAFKNFGNLLEGVAIKKIPAIADCKNKMLAAVNDAQIFITKTF